MPCPGLREGHLLDPLLKSVKLYKFVIYLNLKVDT